MVIDAISEGNRIHDFVYAGAPVDIDVEDAVQIFGADIHIESIEETEYFFLTDDPSHLSNKIRDKQAQNKKAVGILITNGKSVCICVDAQGNLALCDSHKHREHGALVIKARNLDTPEFVNATLLQ